MQMSCVRKKDHTQFCDINAVLLVSNTSQMESLTFQACTAKNVSLSLKLMTELNNKKKTT